MTQRTVTGTLIAWLASYQGPDEVSSKLDDAQVINNLQFSNGEYMGRGENPWTKVGLATVVVTLVDEREMVENKVESLRAEQQSVLAETQNKATQIERKIQTLLVISYEPTPEPEPAPAPAPEFEDDDGSPL